MSPSFSQALMLRKSDQALCAAVRDGNNAAFVAVVTRYRGALLRQCRAMLRDGRAEDAVQQTFVRALQALQTGTEVRELGPWLHRIARNVALNELSVPGRYNAELSEEWEDTGRADQLEQRAELRAALVAVQALPMRQRTALLRSAAGDPPAAIAHELGVSSTAARQLVHRARVAVRAAVHVFAPPPLLALARRLVSVGHKVPRAAGAPAGAAPLASKVAVVVVASASIAAPAAVIHSVLTGRPTPRIPRHAAIQARASVRPVDTYAAAVHPQALPPGTARVPVVKLPIRSAHSRPAPVRSRARAAAPRATAAPPPSRQAGGVSASSPGAPIGSGSGSGAAAQGPVATGAAASADSGSALSASGPIATASASGPTGGSSSSGDAASGSDTGSASTSGSSGP